MRLGFVERSSYGFNDVRCSTRSRMSIETRDACLPGSARNASTGQCTLVDVCMEYPTACVHDSNSSCQPDPKLLYRCVCNAGYDRDSDNRGLCEPFPDQCLSAPCSAPEVCATISRTSHSCTCPTVGARLDNGVCTDCSQPCPAGQYKPGACACAACSTCEPGLTATSDCSETANTVCEDVDDPVIALAGEAFVRLEARQGVYIEPGYAALDKYEGNLSSGMQITTVLAFNGARVFNLSTILHLQGYVAQSPVSAVRLTHFWQATGA